MEAKQAKKLLREEKKKYREEKEKESKEECRRRAFGPKRKRYQCATCEKWARTEGYRDAHSRRCLSPAAKKQKVVKASQADMQKAWFATSPPLSAVPGAVETMGVGTVIAGAVGAGNERTPQGMSRAEGASTLSRAHFSRVVIHKWKFCSFGSQRPEFESHGGHWAHIVF